jgi:hypothetical protein
MRVENSITRDDVRLFSKLVETKGFEYALNYFLLDVFEASEFSMEIDNVLLDEINRLNTLTFSEYNQRKFNVEIVYILGSDKLPYHYKLLLIYQIIIKTIENKNLEISVEGLLIDLFDNLFKYPLSKHQLLLDVLLRVFNERVLTEKDERKQELVLRCIVLTISRYDYIMENSIISRFLAILCVIVYHFVYLEVSVDYKYKLRIRSLLEKQYNNGLSGEAVSLQKLVSKNIDIIADVFPYQVKDLVVDSFDLGYKPDKHFYARSVSYTDSLISELRLSFQMLSMKLMFKLDDFVDLSETNQLKLKSDLEKFIGIFRVDDSNNPYFDKKIKDILSKVSALFGVTNNDFISLNNVFKEANLRLKSLNDTVQNAQNNSIVDNIANYYTDDELTSYELDVNNLDIFGATEDNQEPIIDLLNLSLGVNDIRDLPDNILAGFMDSQSLSIAVKVLFKKHLKHNKINKSNFNPTILSDMIRNGEIDKYNLFNLFKYDASTIQEYGEVLKEIEQERRSVNGLPNVFLSSKKIKFSFKSTIVKRYVLNKQEVDNLLSNKFRVSNGLYKIGTVYLPYEEAYEVVKKNYRRDVFTFRYAFEATEDCGFYIDFV